MQRAGLYIWWDYFRKGEQSGQVATIITLAIAVIFLFVAVTINIGRVAQKKTITSNAADGAAMQLASFIGSYANTLSLTYLRGRTRRSERDWSPLWNLVAAIVVTALTWGGGFWSWGTLAQGAAWASYGYNTIEAPTRMEGQMQRMLSRLSMQDQFTEQSIQYALMNSIDDSAMVPDARDYDEDGDTTDEISRFSQWYAMRLENLVRQAENAAGNGLAQIQTFLPVLQNFAGDSDAFRIQFSEDASRPLILEDPNTGGQITDPNSPAGINGELVQVLQELDQQGIAASFWTPGAVAAGDIDQVDNLSIDLNRFFNWAAAPIGGLVNQPLEALNQIYDMWTTQLYDPSGANSDWQDSWQTHIANIGSWSAELSGIIPQIDTLITQAPVAPDPIDPTILTQADLQALRDRVVNLLPELDSFQDVVRTFNDGVITFVQNSGQGMYAHENFATYSWVDSLQQHHVHVEVVYPPGYVLPYLDVDVDRHVLYTETTIYLRGYTGTVNVYVTRYDQDLPLATFANAQQTPLWTMRYSGGAGGANPQDRPAALSQGITSVSTAQYSYNTTPRIVRAQ
jgi:hypothetical protein